MCLPEESGNHSTEATYGQPGADNERQPDAARAAKSPKKAVEEREQISYLPHDTHLVGDILSFRKCALVTACRRGVTGHVDVGLLSSVLALHKNGRLHVQRIVHPPPRHAEEEKGSNIVPKGRTLFFFNYFFLFQFIVPEKYRGRTVQASEFRSVGNNLTKFLREFSEIRGSAI